MRPHIARFVIFSASLLCIFVVCTLQLNAQTGTAQLSGLVTDSTGAVLSQASVLIVNRDTGVSRPVQTNTQGEYTAPALQPGHYRITVEAKGFQTLVTDNLTLNVAQEASLSFQLKVGTENQTITVDGSGLQINTTDASVSTVIDQKFVENIPLNGRSFQDLISMTPGVVTQSPQANSQGGFEGDFSVNGQRTDSNYYMVDGVSGNTNPGNGNVGSGNNGTLGGATALGTTQSLISVDAMQEFRVESSSYSAEYGHSPGGQFSLVSRSGTNDYHGSAFEYLRNNFFDANDWFNDQLGTGISPLRQNDFGGTFGGPIELPRLYNGKDKSFFFFSYEGLRLTQPKPAQILLVPDNSLRQNAASALKPILNAFPLPTIGGTDYGTLAQFYAPYSLPSAIDSTSIRFDQKISPRLLLFFRFGDTPSSISSRNLSTFTQTKVNTTTYTVGATSVISSKVNDEFRLGYAAGESSLNRHLDTYGGATLTNLAQDMGVGAYASPELLPYLSIRGEGRAFLSVGNQSNGTDQWNITDTLSFLIGHHQFHVGFDYRRIKSILSPSNPLVEAVFESSGAVINDSANVLYTEKVIGSTPIFNNTSAFIQDEWRANKRLALSFGIRWDINPAPTEAHGNDAYTLDGDLANPSTLTLAPRGTSLWNTYWANIAPRLGLAWAAQGRSGWETVVRGGAGVFFDNNNNLATIGYVAGLGFDSTNEFAGAPLPVTPAQLVFPSSVSPPYTNSEIVAFPRHLQSPYTLEWNTAVEQALGKNQTATLSYVGANGRRLVSEQELYLPSVNPNFGIVLTVPGNITSNYQALEAKFQRSVSHGIHALASYTWSHSLDFGSASQVYPQTRGNSDFDVRNSFQGGLSWDLPSVTKNNLGSQLWGGWGLDARLMARSAFPITLDGNFLTDPANGNTYYGNVDLVPDQPIYLYGSQYPGGRAVNPAAFAYPTDPNGIGDAPRNFVRGFGATQINLAARRDFQLHERLKLQFRAELFNILNHPNFGYVDPILGDPTFGQATQMLNQSLGTLASQYQQGGPRSMQFALKLLF